MKARLLAAVAALSLALPVQALAWGASGHRMVGEAAMAALPAEVPAFLRQPAAVRDVGELSREEDRSKGAGKVHDHNRDSAHFLDLDDEGKLLGGPPFLPLPATRADYEKALQSAGLDSWKAGYLPYSIIDRRQQLTKDFAYWRVLTYARAHERNRARRAWYAQDLARRQAQILRTIGELSHFVGDGAQPLHVTVHYNGWGDYPNPNGYTTGKIHGPFEGDFVFANVKPADVTKAMSPLDVQDTSLERRTTEYLLKTSALVAPLYDLEKAGGLSDGNAQGVAFTTDRIAAGASELRNLIVIAWKMSATSNVGWPVLKVEDVLAGKADPYDFLYGKD
ncbi:S1/P1 Nuclease [Phenylobacterium sp.]|jgi:hypothetical protein|uniref:S1/P1 Nuclease n=1 Tax=Phenylobacterium sp. TaxID=1871053 RepID=UPI0035AEF923